MNYTTGFKVTTIGSNTCNWCLHIQPRVSCLFFFKLCIRNNQKIEVFGEICLNLQVLVPSGGKHLPPSSPTRSWPPPLNGLHSNQKHCTNCCNEYVQQSWVHHLLEGTELRACSCAMLHVQVLLKLESFHLETSFNSSARGCASYAKKNTPPSQLDFSSCISQLRHRPEQISRHIRRAWFERVRAERTKCIVVKKNQQYWYQDHWCVCVCVPSGSPEMLSAGCAFCFPPLPPFISSPLLLECRSQVKCKPFPRNVRQSIRDEISPKWRRGGAAYYLDHCL